MNFKNVDVVFEGIRKVFTQKDINDDNVTNSKVGAGLEHDDNIPLRITLRLLDEVFDLADRNIWLRRQMIIVLRQIVKTMFGDTVNKKIVDYFASLTSVDAVSGYLNNIKVRGVKCSRWNVLKSFVGYIFSFDKGKVISELILFFVISYYLARTIWKYKMTA